MTIVVDQPAHTFRCDVCGRTAQGPTVDHPPRGFAQLERHPLSGVGETWHACDAGAGDCLRRLAGRLVADAVLG